MKSFIEEYGKVIIATLGAAVFIVYIFSFGRGADGKPLGLMAQLQEAKPVATVEQDNAHDTLKAYANREEPSLEVSTEALKFDVTYDLLSFVTKAEGDLVDGAPGPVEVNVTKILDPEGNEMTVPAKVSGQILFSFPYYEKDVETGDYMTGYRVTYEAVDNYYSDYPLKTAKTYQFVVN